MQRRTHMRETPRQYAAPEIRSLATLAFPIHPDLHAHEGCSLTLAFPIHPDLMAVVMAGPRPSPPPPPTELHIRSPLKIWTKVSL